MASENILLPVKLKEMVTKILRNPHVANIIALMGGIAYSIQSWFYAHALPSVLDEGNYLYKGYLFASGQYQPFQDYGVWTNHMPLSFLIPGWMQVWFGPGLRTGRYFAVFLGILGLLGLWLLVRRLSGKWLAAGTVWAVALNPFVIQTYSVAVSQGLTACLLIWVLFLTLGEDRKSWQLVLGAGLAGILMLTRINMAPVIILLIPFIFWQSGRRVGLSAMIFGVSVVLIGHIIYWPGILKFWLSIRTLEDIAHALVPEFLLADAVRVVDLGTPYWNPTVSLETRVSSFGQGLRLNFLPVLGVLFAWLSWPRRKLWESDDRYRIAVFLSAVFSILFALHLWASLMRNACVFCFPGYLTFFSVIGLLLLTVAWPHFHQKLTKVRHNGLLFIVFILPMGIGYAARDAFPWSLAKPLWVIAWNALEKYHLTDFDVVEQNLIAFNSMLIGFVLAGIILLIPKLIQILGKYQRTMMLNKLHTNALTVMIIITYILTPTKILSGVDLIGNCDEDVISLMESVGDSLTTNIPARSQIYWVGGSAPTPLVYLPDIGIYPGQLNGVYSIRIGGDLDDLVRRGYRNDELQSLWLQEADYRLIVDRWYFPDSSSYNGWVEVAITPPTEPCTPESAIHILKRAP